MPRAITSLHGRRLNPCWQRFGATCCTSIALGSTENFLQLGGHSLLAIQVVSRVCAQFGVDISAGQFFEHPTVKDFAVLLVQQLMKGAQDGSAPQKGCRASSINA